MSYQRTEIPESDIQHQLDICAQLRAHFTAGGRQPLAMVDTYGCQQNEADSEKLRGYLRAMGFDFTQDEFAADVVVMNTCAVREHAETRVFGNVGALTHTKARNPNQIIAVCGCMAQQEHVAEKLKKSYRIVDLVFGPHELWRFPELLQSVLRTNKRIFAVDDSAGNIAEGIPVVRSSNLKAWVSIMYGCNNFCSKSRASSRRAIRTLRFWARTSTPTARIWGWALILPTSWPRSRSCRETSGCAS